MIKTYTILLCFVLLSCNQNLKSPKHSIQGSLAKFPSTFTNHFPSANKYDLLGYHISYPDSTISRKMGASLYALYRLDNRSKTEIDSIKDLASYYGSYSNDSLFHLPEKNYSKNEIICQNKLDLAGISHFPIPNLKNIKLIIEDVPISELESELQFYGLEAESGEFLPNGLLFPNNNLDEFWAHGYSKGFVFHERSKSAVYWIEIW